MSPWPNSDIGGRELCFRVNFGNARDEVAAAELAGKRRRAS
jgi:hypothetical protein